MWPNVFLLVIGFWRVLGMLLGWGRVTLTRGALDIVPVVAGPDVLIEHGPVATFECVLFTIVMTIVIHLNSLTIHKTPDS